MSQPAFKAPVVERLSALLRPLGFRKAAATFIRPTNDVIHLIEVQSSSKSTSAEAIYTVNVAIFVPTLIYEDVRAFIKPSVSASHWRERIGNLSERKADKWWSARTTEEAEANAFQIADLVTESALPALAMLSSVESIQSLWAAGRSPGLTEQQRNEYMYRLNNMSKKP